ncbi:hypothetical protein GCM10023187_00840 [Nibrella viscosa]|uniref:Oxygen tolerance n=1 Tax=Nibrella viscosa TaxID=1084524 RepID=A0ABP8JRQ7_9BACT
MHRYGWVLLSLFLAGGLVSRAQTFRQRAEISAVTTPGYYRILLPPAVVGALNEALTDVRLYDSRQREVPYLLSRQLPRQQTQLRPLPAVSQTVTPRSTTTWVVRNAAKSRITALGVTIRNTNVTKQARLSGSNDTRLWYAIEADYRLEPTRSDTTTSAVKVLDFPLSDYEYYRLEINDSLTAPLNILSVGIFSSNQEAGTYREIRGLTFVQHDSSALRKTFLHITLPDTARLDKLRLLVQSPGPYRRSAEVMVGRQRRGRRGPVTPVFETIRTFELSAAGDQTVYLSGLRARKVYVVVDNQDSPPLTIRGVQAYQADVYLIARLDAGTPYHLRFGNPSVRPPVYDLVYFRDSLPARLPIVTVTGVRSEKPTGTPDTASFFRQPWILWPALSLVLLLLGLLSYRMLTEMNGSRENA